MIAMSSCHVINAGFVIKCFCHRDHTANLVLLIKIFVSTFYEFYCLVCSVDNLHFLVLSMAQFD